jgi:hypothetical protein
MDRMARRPTAPIAASQSRAWLPIVSETMPHSKTPQPVPDLVFLAYDGATTIRPLGRAHYTGKWRLK